MDIVDGWEVAVRYPDEPKAGANAIVDVSHQSAYEITGPQTHEMLRTLCGGEVPIRSIHIAAVLDRNGGFSEYPEFSTYRLTDERAIVFGDDPVPDAIDVTGGWASVALFGPAARTILGKITAVDLRDVWLSIGHCCQGPIFGVNTLFGRFANRFELHVCPDSMEFLWQVLLDAGREFQLKPAGLRWIVDDGSQIRV